MATASRLPNWPQDVRELVQFARGDLTQKSFAQSLGVSQSSVCKYEAGTQSPPAGIIDQCLKRIAQRAQLALAATAEELGKRVVEGLDGRKHAATRVALAALLAAIVSEEDKRGRPGTPKRSNA